MTEKDKKDTHQSGTQSGPPAGRYDLPNQESIDLLIRLLRDFDRRSDHGSALPPEIERDLAVVIAAFRSIESALALRDSPIKITSVAPSGGAAGTAVTITGSNFLTGSRVRFGSNDANDVSIVSLTEIRVTAPSGAPGAVDVVVNTLAGSAVRAQGFTYPPSGGAYR